MVLWITRRHRAVWCFDRPGRRARVMTGGQLVGRPWTRHPLWWLGGSLYWETRPEAAVAPFMPAAPTEKD